MATSWTRKNFQRRLDDLLTARKMTQVELADKLGLAQSAVSEWLSDKKQREPSPGQIAQIADILGCRAAWLAFDGDKQPMDEEESAIVENFRKLARSQKDIYGDLFKKLAVYDAPAQAVSEPAAVYPEKNVTPVDRRAEILTFPFSRAKRKGFAEVQQLSDVAAGDGRELELCEDLLYFSGLDNFKGLQTAVIRGDSMVKTLRPGDVIVVKLLKDVALRSLERNLDKTSLSIWQANNDIRHDDICIVSINGDSPTLKRIKYDTRRGSANWKMQIHADNPASTFDMFQADTGDNVAFYAKLIGRGTEKK